MKKYIDALKQYALDASTSDPKTGACWEGYQRVPNTKKGEPGSCEKIGASTSEGDYKYENPKTGEIYTYSRRGTYKKDGTMLVYKGKADKPSKNDPRRTPAPKKDQKKGSKKNKPDSAKNPSGKITFSKEVTAQLSKKVKEHNAKGKGSKATLGMLKAVYRRGAGAYSSSHAPKMSRHGWAIARVNAFLTLLRTGKPSNSAYTQDNDLLPKGHPKKSSKGKMKDDQIEYHPQEKKDLDKNKDGKINKEDVKLIRKEKDSKGFIEDDIEWLEKTESAEYQGRKVTLNKPFLTPDGPKKRSVYVKNEKGNVVKVNFGDPNMKIKKNDPARRKSFRARHNCDNPGPKWKARYWSCKMW
tara:strand:+ start:877 stop:1941 length:1065 start_codon:yes stop_codon:yes gene_type:complete